MNVSPAVAVRQRLSAHASSVGEARRTVRRTLRQGGREDLIDDAELLVSELVTNAVVHAGTHVDLKASFLRGGLRIEVTDGSDHLPTRRDYSGLAGTGRGLKLLERLVDRWGVVPHSVGKTVWFELGTAPPAGDGGRTRTSQHPDGSAALPRRTGDEPQTVVLMNVPLLLHGAWQMHAESVLREYLLAKLIDEDSSAVIMSNAACNDAMSLLRSSIPAPDLGADPEALMADATEPFVSSERATMSVPRASVEHFELLDETLTAASTMADAGGFLTAPTQPELRLLRQWLCHQVRSQSRGGTPTAWTVGQEPLAAPSPKGAAITQVPNVTDSEGALIAADDTARMVAVSRAAAALLGYAEEAQLVGRRLLHIIPPRYHQAHLAGFTMHLASGRSPLLGRPVTVPVVRVDGTEVWVQLTVQSRVDPDGSRLFVADLVAGD